MAADGLTPLSFWMMAATSASVAGRGTMLLAHGSPAGGHATTVLGEHLLKVILDERSLGTLGI